MRGVLLVLYLSRAFSLKLLEDPPSSALTTSGTTPDDVICERVPTALTLKTGESKLMTDYLSAKDAVSTDKTDVTKREILLQAAAKICSAPSEDMFSENPEACAGYCVDEDSSVSFYKTNDCVVCSSSQCGSRTAKCFSNPPDVSTGPKMVDTSTKAKIADASAGPKIANVAGGAAEHSAAAFNDPKVVNMAGESFEIMSTGTFSMLRASVDEVELVAISATIDRAGSRCGATYIQNASIMGTWIQDLGFSKVDVRAAAAVPKVQALEVNVDDSAWVKPSELRVKNTSSAVGSLQLHIRSLKVSFTVDSHRIVEGSRKTRRFANFLNLQIQNAKKSFGDGASLTGLLSNDNHDEVSRTPSECKSQDVKLLSKAIAGTTVPVQLENAGLDLHTYLEARRQ